MEFLVFLIVILIFSAVLHEIMHGVVADKLGDPTARLMGRLTLNPIPHLDPIMSVLLPALLVIVGSPIIFGAAKPVPIQPHHFRDPKKDMALSALAGPLTNILIALTAGTIFRFAFPGQEVLNYIYGIQFTQSASPDLLFPLFVAMVIYVNLILAIINLIPIPPLDGSKVLAAILPDDIAATYLSLQQYGFFILIALLLFPLGPLSLGVLLRNLIVFSLTLMGI